MLDATPFQIIGIMAHRGKATSFEDDPNNVITCVKHVGHVVCIKVDTPRVVAEGRFQQLIRSHFLSIDISFINPKAADIESRLADVFFQSKFLAQIAGGNGSMTIQLVIIKITTYPVGMPVVTREKTNFKILDVALKMLTIIIRTIGNRSINLPPATITAFEFFPLVWNIKHLIRNNRLAVPQVANAIAGIFLTTGHNNAVFRLNHIVFFRLVLPAKARLGSGQRLAAILHLHCERGQLNFVAVS